LTYSWATLSAPKGAPTPTFSLNNSNDARDTTVTFGLAGSYSFRATVTDQDGLSVTSDVTVSVVQTASSIVVSPNTASLAVTKTKQFTAVEYDQFGRAMTRQPTFAWAVTGGPGSISRTGLYTAPGTMLKGQTASVVAMAGSLSGTASVTVTSRPVITKPAAASPNPGTGIGTTLSVTAVDAGYSAGSLTYTWALTSGPAGVNFANGNGTASAARLAVHFTQAGVYHFQVTVRDPSGATATSTVAVTVRQKATAISVTPSTASVPAGGTQQLQAVALDQFGKVMTVQPSFTWSLVSGVGTVSRTGLYRAPATATSGQTAQVRVTVGSLRGTASLTIS
jgi:hypothetical protein